MASTLTALNSTFSAIFSTISTSANSVTKAVTVATAGLDMADTYLTAAKERQLIDTANTMENYETRALMTAAEEQQSFEEGLLTRVHASAKKKAHYEDCYAKLVEAQAKRRALTA